jgi:16S rRNA (uracil1498-N3)-methyltransferase
MRTVRVYSEMQLAGESTVSLGVEAARHVIKVLRMRSGDPLVLFDGSGKEYTGILSSIDKKTVTVELGPGQTPATESPLKITLWHGICRGERMDYVIQKATELGVNVIQPVFTTRGVVRLDDKRTDKRLQHWRKIVIAAAEQSGRVLLAEILMPVTLSAALADSPPAQAALLLDPRGTAAIDSCAATAGLTVLTGPEGGFTEQERDDAQAAGFLPVRLGPRILRSETAPIAALTILQHRYGDLDHTNG